MNMSRENNLAAIQREAERLRAQAIRNMAVAFVRKIASLFGANRKPHGGVAAGA